MGVVWTAVVAVVEYVGGWWAAASYALTIASVAYQLLSSPEEPDRPSGTHRSDPGLRINTRSTQEFIPVLYGEVRLAGNDIYMGVAGGDNDELWLVMGISEGPCEGIVVDGNGNDKVYLGEKQGHEFGSFADWYFHSGTASQTVDSNLNSAKPEWTDPLHYLSYVVFHLTWNSSYFRGIPQRSVQMKGRKLYDPRDGTTAYSNNPALVIRDYMTNNRYGLGIATDKVDDSSFMDGADYFDSKDWSINMAIRSDNRGLDNLNNLVAHCRSSLVWYDGKYYLRYADLNEESSVMDLTDSMVLQDEDGKMNVNISQASSFKSPDGIRVKYTNVDKGSVFDDITIGEESGVLKQIELEGCSSRKQAADIGTYRLEREQLNRVISGTYRGEALKLEPGDVVNFSSDRLSISDQLMRIDQAKILPDDCIDLTMSYEDITLYDDDYNLDEDQVYECDLPSITAEPPSVSNVNVTEENYNFRLRTQIRLKVTFDEPANYAWYDHVEVWTSYDGSTYRHRFNAVNDFEIDPVEEGTTYYIRLKVVSINGVKQNDANDYKISKTVTGYSQTNPTSLGYLEAIVNENSINLYSAKVADPDVELYEFRLGNSWSGGIFLAALRSPNLSLNGVKPGSHTFYANTLGTNDLYGTSPVSESVTLQDPPDGWAVQSSTNFDTLVTNGDMEADANWNNYGTPTTQERSNTQAYGDTYSRKFTVDAGLEGIKSDTFTTTNSRKYGWSAWVYPDDTTSVQVRIRKGDDSGDIYDQEHTGLTQDSWNFVHGTFTEGAATGGINAYIAFLSPSGQSTGTWYIDDVCLLSGDYTDTVPILYNGTAYIKADHDNALTGTYQTPIIDLGSSGRYLTYILAGVKVIGTGNTWSAIVPSPDTWTDINVTTKTWVKTFELEEGATVEMTLYYGDASPPTNALEKFEILSGICTGQYFYGKVSITDPKNSTYAYVENLTLKFCQ